MTTSQNDGTAASGGHKQCCNSGFKHAPSDQHGFLAEMQHWRLIDRYFKQQLFDDRYCINDNPISVAPGSLMLGTGIAGYRISWYLCTSISGYPIKVFQAATPWQEVHWHHKQMMPWGHASVEIQSWFFTQQCVEDNCFGYTVNWCLEDLYQCKTLYRHFRRQCFRNRYAECRIKWCFGYRYQSKYNHRCLKWPCLDDGYFVVKNLKISWCLVEN